MTANSEIFQSGAGEGRPLGAGRWAGWLFALLMVGAVIFAAMHWGDVEKFTELAAHARPAWLAAALVLQLATYALLSAQWWLVLRRGRTALPIRSLLPITISKLFADQVV